MFSIFVLYCCVLWRICLQMAAGEPAKSVGLEPDVSWAQGPGWQARRRHDFWGLVRWSMGEHGEAHASRTHSMNGGKYRDRQSRVNIIIVIHIYILILYCTASDSAIDFNGFFLTIHVRVYFIVYYYIILFAVVCVCGRVLFLLFLIDRTV